MSQDKEMDHYELMTDANVREGRYDRELAEELQAVEDVRRRAEAEYKNFRMIWDALRKSGK